MRQRPFSTTLFVAMKQSRVPGHTLKITFTIHRSSATCFSFKNFFGGKFAALYLSRLMKGIHAVFADTTLSWLRNEKKLVYRTIARKDDRSPATI